MLQIDRKFKKWQWRHKFLTWRHRHFFDIALFLLSRLVTGPIFMSVSSLVLELRQFRFIRDWQEIRKSEIPPSVFCSISGYWDNLRIPNMARTSLIKCYWMMQNARVTAFTISELLRENQQRGVGGKITPLPPRLGLSSIYGVTVMQANSDHALCLLSWHILTSLLISRGTTMSITKQRVLWIVLAVHCVKVSKYAVISGRYSVWMREITDQK